MTKPTLTKIVPVLGIDSYEVAVAHYVEWLGFTLDWEWRSAPGEPVIMSISRDGIAIMLNEHEDTARSSSITIQVNDLAALEDEWLSKRPEGPKLIIEAPYDIPSINTFDPFGNSVVFSQPVSKKEEARRKALEREMEEWVAAELAAGRPRPTPQQLVEECGRPIGLAMDVLCKSVENLD